MKIKGKFEAKEEYFIKNGALLLEKQISSCEGKGIAVRMFTAEELIKATNNYDTSLFHSRIQSTVYRGEIDGRIVAVKTPEGLQVSDFIIEFVLNQAVTQIQINHKHVVKLLGCCLETEIPILVQEFIPNGSLSDHIRSYLGPFSWSNRLQIATEIADAVTYLHCFKSNPIIHRDIRSNNVLLDENYVSKLSNFGFSVVIPSGKTGTEFGVRGIEGYIDPEYIESAKLSEKCDVYSVGVVLLELLFWKVIETEPFFVAKFMSAMEAGICDQILDNIEYREQEQTQTRPQNLAFYTRFAREKIQVERGSINKDGDRAQMLPFAKLAFKCVQLKGKDRPTMMEVAKELRRIRDTTH